MDSFHTNPSKADNDEDGLNDREEPFLYATNPLKVDIDGDEIKIYRTDPKVSDTDGDGLLDGEEVKIYATNPSKSDSDAMNSRTTRRLRSMA